MFLFDKIDTVPFWKKIYQTASGYSQSVTNDIVDEILKVTGEDLKAGYTIYETYSDDEYQKWEKTNSDEDNDLNNFIKRLCKCLNLKPKVALPIFFNYLMFEYYGKIEDIKNLILYEHSAVVLLENVWQFYSSERMYYVKTLRHVFECSVKEDCVFRNEYINFITSLNIKEFRKMLISQFKSLINEITEESLDNSYNKKDYVNRNNREQLEFILLIIMTVEYKEISVEEFSELFDIFLLHNFTRQPVYFDATLYGESKDFIDVNNAEIGCFIIGIHQINERIKTLPKSIEVSLKDIQNQGDHKIVLFSWVLSKLKNLDENESELIYTYENLLRILIQNKIFISIHKFLSNKLMRTDMRATKLIQAGIFKLLNEFLIALDSKEILVEDDGLIRSITCLMEDPEIALECTSAKGGLDVVVKTNFERFNFVPQTEFCKVLVRHETLSNVVVSLLNGIKTNQNSYFNYLSRLMRELFEIPRLNEQIFREISLGFELIHEIIKYYKGNIHECGFFNCLDLLSQFINVNNQNCNNFIKIHFKIHSAMILYQNSTIEREFYVGKMSRNFLPTLKTQEKIPEVLMQRHIIDSILLQILRKEEHEVEHSTIRSYLNLILYSVDKNLNMESVQIPGVIYMITFVFPYHKNWQYEDPDEMIEISGLCLKIMLNVLDNNVEILKNFLFVSLLKNPSMMNIFLQYLIKEKFYLQKVMLNEIDWINGKTLERITISKLHLSIFLRLLNDCDLKPSDPVLRSKIQTVTKCAASFITNAFSSSLANLACRLLEKLSQDPDIPILAVLEMDYTQIQCLFLEKLRDPLEDDIFKMTVLDFINTSLLSQNGLTAAFFNALDENSKKNSQSNDSVCDFMIDYLQNIQKSSDYLTNPVQKSILRVFSTLWSTGRENLVQDIYTLKSFWPLLTDALFHPRIKDPGVYTHIMTITTIHLLEYQKNIDKNLKDVLTSFFKNEKLIDEWINYIEIVTNDHYEEAMNFIFAWKKLLVSIKTFIPEVITLDTVKCKLIHSCLKGILWHFNVIMNNRVITDFSDLYLILTTVWCDSYKNEIETILLLTSVLNNFVANCKLPSLHNREVFLTIIHKTIRDCGDLFETHTNLLTNLLKPVGLLIDNEYARLFSKNNDADCKLRVVMCWVLVTRIGDSILSLKNVENYAVFFKYHKYLTRILESIRLVINDFNTLPMVKMLLNTLIHYSKSELSTDFLMENYTIIYDIIDDSKCLYPTNKEELSLNLKEQWISYTMVVKLNHILLNKFGEKMLENNFTFLSVYDRIISQMICLPECTVDARALDLSCETLEYLVKMMEFSDVWSIKHSESFGLIIASIKKILNVCISTILRPENINFYKINKLGKLTFHPTSSDLTSKIVNKMLELACLALRCLIKCNPSMVQLLSIERTKSSTYLLIDYDFTIPKFDVSTDENLTYGRLLCMIYFLCKTLNIEFKNSELDSGNKRKGLLSLEVTKDKSLGEIFEKFTLFDEEFIGFVEYAKNGDYTLQANKKSAFLHYGEHGTSNGNSEWIKDIKKEKIQMTLEYVMSFLAVQVFYHVHTLVTPQLNYFKRELYSELQFFYEYAKKIATDEFNKLLPKRRSDLQNSDVINRLLVEKLSKNGRNSDEICDNFYLLVISKWFMNICKLS